MSEDMETETKPKPSHVTSVSSILPKQEDSQSSDGGLCTGQINVNIYFDEVFAFELKGVSKSDTLSTVRTRLSNFLAKKGAVVVKFHKPKVGAIDPDAEDQNEVGDILGKDNRVDLKPEAVNQTKPQGGSDRNTEYNKTTFLATLHALPSFESNGDKIPILGRTEQIKLVADTVNKGDQMKATVMVIISSRGMGKTFFLKKLCRMKNGPLTPARKLGRIITVECKAGSDFLVDKVFSQFWSRVIVAHLIELFHGCVVNIGTQAAPVYVNFEPCPPATIIALSNLTEPPPSPFAAWVRSTALETLLRATGVLIRITNNMFGVTDSCKPVFLLDNVHALAQQSTTEWSATANRHHTHLSKILEYLLAGGQPVCIVAGTDDGNIEILGSTFRVIHIYLTMLGTQHWNELGRAYTNYANLKSPKKVAWRDILQPHEVGLDEPLRGVDTGQGDEDVDTSCEDDPVYTSTEEGYYIPVAADRYTLLSMIYQTCQIPRLMRICFEEWLRGKQASPQSVPQYITMNFEREAHSFYQDARERILMYTAAEFALMFLACSVHWPVEYYLLGDDSPQQFTLSSSNKFNVKELVDKALIFPYRISALNQKCCYIMPSVFWDGVSSSQADLRVTVQWDAVKAELRRLVPGLDWRSLHHGFSSWWTSTLSLTGLGNLYEYHVAAALAAKFRLWKESNSSRVARMSDIYAIANTAQAHTLVSSLTVDFSHGIQRPGNEVTFATRPLLQAVHLNCNSPTAHHDMICYTTPGPAACQCKHSLTDPKGGDVAKQLAGTDILLWFYLGRDEDSNVPPKKYNNEIVQQKMNENKLGFLSGAGCASPFVLDFLILMKKLVKSIRTQ